MQKRGPDALEGEAGLETALPQEGSFLQIHILDHQQEKSAPITSNITTSNDPVK